MSKKYLSVKEYLRLQEYLYKLHTSGKVCVFSHLSGHVDWLDIQISESKDAWEIELYTKQVYIGRETNNDCEEETDRQIVDKIIKEIKEKI